MNSMKKTNISCTSCSTDITNNSGSVKFKCPKCEHEIVRCSTCRKIVAPFVCQKCGFKGPN